jgi:hypothetical protein
MTFRGAAVKPSNHLNTTCHLITPSAVWPFIPTEGPDQTDWHEPSVVTIRLPESESPAINVGPYTDLQTARVFAEHMRQLIVVYRSLYGEFYWPPRSQN